MHVALTFDKGERESIGNFFKEASMSTHDNDKVSTIQLNSNAAKGTDVEAMEAIGMDLVEVGN